MDSKDKPQSPKDKASDPLTPSVGPGTNEEGAAVSLAYAKHIEQQRRPVTVHQRSSVSPATPKK